MQYSDVKLNQRVIVNVDSAFYTEGTEPTYGIYVGTIKEINPPEVFYNITVTLDNPPNPKLKSYVFEAEELQLFF